MKELQKALSDAEPENFLNDLKEFYSISVSKNGELYFLRIKNGLGEKKVPFFAGTYDEVKRLSEKFNRIAIELKEIVKNYKK